MSEHRQRYSVYGRLRAEPRTYINEWLGYVKAFNSEGARIEAKKEYGKRYIIKQVVKERTGR